MLLKTRASGVLKTVDRYAGIPLVWLLGRFQRRPMPERMSRIGVLRTAAIGDTLLLAGPLRDLRAAFPDAHIVLVTGADNAEAGALVAHGVATHVVIPVRNPLGAMRALRRLRLDALVDTGAWPRLDALLTATSGARFRLGFRSARQHRHFAFDLCVAHARDAHELENFRSLMRAFGVPTGLPPQLDRTALPRDVRAPDGPFLVFHAWSGGYRGRLKEWHGRNWVELANRLRDLSSLVILTGSAAQRAQTESLAASIGETGVTVNVRVGEPLSHVGALLCRSIALVSVNTGLMHLGAQLGVPTVALDGPTPPARWGPVGPAAVSVTSALRGCGYLDLGFEYSGQREDCMDGISVDAVERAVRNLVAAGVTRSPAPPMRSSL